MTPPNAPLRFTLEGQMPSGKNQVRFDPRSMRKFPNPRFERWRAAAWPQLQRQRGDWKTLEVPAGVIVRYTPGDLIRRDAPGVMDALSHLLEWCPVCKSKRAARPRCPIPAVRDDSLLTAWDFKTLPLDRARPRLEAVVTPL